MGTSNKHPAKKFSFIRLIKSPRGILLLAALVWLPTLWLPWISFSARVKPTNLVPDINRSLTQEDYAQFSGSEPMQDYKNHLGHLLTYGIYVSPCSVIVWQTKSVQIKHDIVSTAGAILFFLMPLAWSVYLWIGSRRSTGHRVRDILLNSLLFLFFAVCCFLIPLVMIALTVPSISCGTPLAARIESLNVIIWPLILSLLAVALGGVSIRLKFAQAREKIKLIRS